MKKLFSILFATLILLSGMHLSLATHICSGEISATKWSVFDEKATCGMESDNAAKPAENSFTSECCQDQISFYSVDNNYNPSSTTQINEPVKQLLQVFDIPKVLGILFYHTNSTSNTYVQPPGNYIANAVSLPDICVFRI
ncbi:MAG: hypothetical protein VB066_01645 [Paludibacter sp.]|jgi:hypothetical protein|nr:hypothetical protein [Paludibacter sp.]